METPAKKLNILAINCDWRDLFTDAPEEFLNKFKRDRLMPEANNFFVFSWSKVGYAKKLNEHFYSLHKKTHFGFFKPLLDLLTLWLVPFYLRHLDFKPDVIMVYDFGFLPAAKRLQKRLGGQVVLVLGTIPEMSSAARAFGSLRSWYSRQTAKWWTGLADQYYVINDTVKDYLITVGADQVKIKSFTLNTIERDREFIAKADRQLIRSELKINQDKKVILCVARLESEKDHVRLLNLFATLDDTYELVLVGEGSLRSRLEQLAVDLDIAKRVHFVGLVGRAKIWHYYAAANVFVLLSKAEALGLVFWEAMFMGVPVIGSEAPGILETIGGDQARGKIIQSGDNEVDQFLAAMKFCTNPSDELAAMVDRAKSYVIEKNKDTRNFNDIIIL